MSRMTSGSALVVVHTFEEVPPSFGVPMPPGDWRAIGTFTADGTTIDLPERSLCCQLRRMGWCGGVARTMLISIGGSDSRTRPD